MAIGVPGCPELACCTASMESVRMVLMESVSRSIVGIGAACSIVCRRPSKTATTMSLETIVDKPDAIPEILTRRFEARSRAAIQERGRFSAALPGGSVATACFPRLAAASVDWPRVDLYWGDERG